MFGLGDQNKEKLEQNMEEIKRMVDEEADMPAFEEDSEWSQVTGENVWDDANQQLDEDSSEPAQGQMEQIQQQEEPKQNEPTPEPEPKQNQPEPNDNPEPQNNSRPQDPAFDSFNDTIDGSRALQQEIESFEESMEQEMEDEAWEVQQNQPEQSPNRNARKQRTKNNNSRSKSSVSIPEPAKTRKIDVPEIEKGPLFIRQNKFERATQLVYDMKYLADEIQSIVNTIEGDVERDRETENQLIEALAEFDGGRTQVEKIISPGEE